MGTALSMQLAANFNASVLDPKLVSQILNPYPVLRLWSTRRAGCDGKCNWLGIRDRLHCYRAQIGNRPIHSAQGIERTDT